MLLFYPVCTLLFQHRCEINYCNRNNYFIRMIERKNCGASVMVFEIKAETIFCIEAYQTQQSSLILFWSQFHNNYLILWNHTIKFSFSYVSDLIKDISIIHFLWNIRDNKLCLWNMLHFKALYIRFLTKIFVCKLNLFLSFK